MSRSAWTRVSPAGVEQRLVVHAGDDGIVPIQLPSLEQLLLEAGYHRAPELTHGDLDPAGRTACCGRSPFELPTTDRLTNDPSLVTCPGRN